MKRGRFGAALLVAVLMHLSLRAGGEWYDYYENGLKEMDRGNWSLAIANFKEALKVKERDSKKMRTYGMHFIEYFPHREMGIAYYYLGNVEFARQQLQTSLSQEYSARAQDFLSKIDRGEAPPKVITPQPPVEEPPKVIKTPPRRDEKKAPARTEEPKPEPERTMPAPTLVGERLSIAVLPFETKGVGRDLGELDLLDKIITAFVNQNRFKVMERAQLEKILEEQKLGMSGVIDASTAAQIGKGIGVDAVVLGSVTRAENTVGIDARLIDTETAAIIVAQDAYSTQTTIQNLTQMIGDLAAKITHDFPLIDGYVIAVEGSKITVDLGRNRGAKRGMKCTAYREGGEIIHPITKAVLGKKIEQLGELRLTEIFDAYSIGKVEKQTGGMLQVGDKVISK